MTTAPKRIQPKDRLAWRTWLTKHHAAVPEIWVVYYKKHTGRQTFTYRESVEEALCFGWIDGIKKRLDDATYTHRFTPRRRSSHWSPLNIRLAEKLIATGQMTPAGLSAFKQGKAYNADFLATWSAGDIALTPDIEKALQAHPVAWENFQNLPAGARKQYLGWLQTAKRPETRARRLREAIDLLAQNLRLGMK